jgi:hypothetical protein
MSPASDFINCVLVSSILLVSVTVWISGQYEGTCIVILFCNYIWRKKRVKVQGNFNVVIRNVLYNLWRSLFDTYWWEYSNCRIDLERYKPRWVEKALRLNGSRIKRAQMLIETEIHKIEQVKLLLWWGSHHHHHRQYRLSWATAFLRRFCHICLESDHTVFSSLDFATVIFLQSKDVSLASSPQPGEQYPCIYVPQWRVAQLYPQALGYLFVTFYYSQGYGGGNVARLRTGRGPSSPIKYFGIFIPNILPNI